MLIPMVDFLILLRSALTSLFRSRARLEAEILVLRQQINVLRRNSPKRFVFRPFDRLVLVGLYRLAPTIVDALAVVSTRGRGSLAPGWVSIVLALEIQRGPDPLPCPGAPRLPSAHQRPPWRDCGPVSTPPRPVPDPLPVGVTLSAVAAGASGVACGASPLLERRQLECSS